MSKGAVQWVLDWRGALVQRDIERKLARAVGEIGLRVEAGAKAELRPGHGVRTGTLRRSIHAADPTYNFAADRGLVAGAMAARRAYKSTDGFKGIKKPKSPEMGGKAPLARRLGERLMVAVGSGLEYAMPVHQGHRSFAGYHYITRGLEKVRPRVLGIIRSYLSG